MALSYKTYYALPCLRHYTEAKTYHDRIKPIRGDKYETRPAGRRDQKWNSIWEDSTSGAIHVGYGCGEPTSRRPLVTYHKSGVISVPRYSSRTSAAENERLQRFLGVPDIKATHYEQWIKCTWYDGGAKRMGYLPTRHNGSRSWRETAPVTSDFVRDGDGDLVFLNYQYPVIHRINRKNLKEVYAPYRPCLDYTNNLCKLQGGHLVLSHDLMCDMFGRETANRNLYSRPPEIRHGEGVDTHRANLLTLMKSDDLNNWLRATAILAYNSVTNYYLDRGRDLRRSNPIEWFARFMIKEYRDTVLDTVTHTEGKIVRDKYCGLFFS